MSGPEFVPFQQLSSKNIDFVQSQLLLGVGLFEQNSERKFWILDSEQSYIRLRGLALTLELRFVLDLTTLSSSIELPTFLQMNNFLEWSLKLSLVMTLKLALLESSFRRASGMAISVLRWHFIGYKTKNRFFHRIYASTAHLPSRTCPSASLGAPHLVQ